jgi:outer membrane lipoprotein-sorting protein
MLALLLFVLFVQGAPEGPLRPVERQPADALLKQVDTMYAALTSYRDEGIVVTSFHGKKEFTTRKPFFTIYSRAGLFRYEFTQNDDRYVVWRDRAMVRSWWTVTNQLECFRDLSDALAGPTGVSGGSAHTVPTLLMGSDGKGWRITSLSSPVVLGTQDVAGCPGCTVVEGKHPRQAVRYRLWIHPQTLALMRLEQYSSIAGGTEVISTATYRPQLNPSIDPASTRFTPPAGATPEGRCK